MILLQVDLTSGDELKIVCEGCYEIEDAPIFVWSWIPDIGHYYLLRDSIRWLLPDSTANYLIHTIQQS